jgi:regulator of protease activity HflC (stomatin/prohibitin superfamily)
VRIATHWKLAAVIVDNEPHLLETGIYYIRSNNFVIKPSHVTNMSTNYFYDSVEPVIHCGSLLRLMPPPNTVAVYNDFSEQNIFPDAQMAASNSNGEENQSEKRVENGFLEIKNPNVKFSTFLKTDLINKNYPTAKDQFTYYTKDSVQVGVKLFVAYRIFDPRLAIEKLGPTGIDDHIEHVTHVDMARAGQETSLQGIQSSSDLKIDSKSPGSTENESSTNDNPPAYHQIYLSAWQESVKKQLEKDLKEYGIQLVRLNIEEINILNRDVENEMGKQAVSVAKANADLAAINMQKEVALQKAQNDSEVAQLKARQEAATNLITAENKKNVAELEKETTFINAEAKAAASRVFGETLNANAELAEFEKLRLTTSYFKGTNVTTVFFGNSSPFNHKNDIPIDVITRNLTATNS